METELFALVAETRRGRRITAGKLTGQKPALKMKEVRAIRTRLELGRRIRDLALFNLAIDGKLRGCDLMALKVDDVAAAGDRRTELPWVFAD